MSSEYSIYFSELDKEYNNVINMNKGFFKIISNCLHCCFSNDEFDNDHNLKVAIFNNILDKICEHKCLKKRVRCFFELVFDPDERLCMQLRNSYCKDTTAIVYLSFIALFRFEFQLLINSKDVEYLKLPENFIPMSADHMNQEHNKDFEEELILNEEDSDVSSESSVRLEKHISPAKTVNSYESLNERLEKHKIASSNSLGSLQDRFNHCHIYTTELLKNCALLINNLEDYIIKGYENREIKQEIKDLLSSLSDLNQDMPISDNITKIVADYQDATKNNRVIEFFNRILLPLRDSILSGNDNSVIELYHFLKSFKDI